jgi:hypothetical protein
MAMSAAARSRGVLPEALSLGDGRRHDGCRLNRVQQRDRLAVRHRDDEVASVGDETQHTLLAGPEPLGHRLG